MRWHGRGMAGGMGFVLAATAGLLCVTLSGCTSTREYTLANGTSANEVQCTLWYQCTHEAAQMCPHGYRLVKGPHRPQPALPNGNRLQGPSRIDFVCNATQ